MTVKQSFLLFRKNAKILYLKFGLTLAESTFVVTVIKIRSFIVKPSEHKQVKLMVRPAELVMSQEDYV